MPDVTLIGKVFDAVLEEKRGQGQSDKQILQWAADNCPCDNCRTKRGESPNEHFAIPCPQTEAHPDYHPLSLDEIRNMAMKAFHAANEHGGHWQTNDIMRRLCQAIPGQTCPHNTRGHVNDVEIHLCEYYIANVKWHGADPTFAEELHSIINS